MAGVYDSVWRTQSTLGTSWWAGCITREMVYKIPAIFRARKDKRPEKKHQKKGMLPNSQGYAAKYNRVFSDGNQLCHKPLMMLSANSDKGITETMHQQTRFHSKLHVNAIPNNWEQVAKLLPRKGIPVDRGPHGRWTLDCPSVILHSEMCTLHL